MLVKVPDKAILMDSPDGIGPCLKIGDKYYIPRLQWMESPDVGAQGWTDINVPDTEDLPQESVEISEGYELEAVWHPDTMKRDSTPLYSVLH